MASRHDGTLRARSTTEDDYQMFASSRPRYSETIPVRCPVTLSSSQLDAKLTTQNRCLFHMHRCVTSNGCLRPNHSSCYVRQIIITIIIIIISCVANSLVEPILSLTSRDLVVFFFHLRTLSLGIQETQPRTQRIEHPPPLICASVHLRRTPAPSILFLHAMAMHIVLLPGAMFVIGSITRSPMVPATLSMVTDRPDPHAPGATTG